MKYEESEKIELKRQLTSDLAKEIIAFLNAEGGTIYIGVEDDGSVLGVPKEEKDMLDQKISSMVSDAILPCPRKIISFGYRSDDVLAIHVQEGEQKPYYLSSKGPRPSGTYIRVGRTKRQASEDEILFMLLESRKISYEKEISEEQTLHFGYAEGLAKDKKVDFGEREFLSLGMKDKQGRFTNLALLISEENPIEVKLAVYDDKRNFKSKKTFSGSILKIADQALEYADLLNETSAVIVPYQAARIEKKSFPGASLREAVLNAFCHANYLKPSNIMIEFYKDRVEITSPGGIFDGNLEQILQGYQTFRNPGLVRIFDKFGYIENFGQGMKRIIEAYENEDKKPSFDVNKIYFRVILPNMNDVDDAQSGTKEPLEPRNYVNDASNNAIYVQNEPQNEPLEPQNEPQNEPLEPQNEPQNEPKKTLIHQRIVELISDNPKITKIQMASKIGVSRATIQRALWEANDIKFVGSSRTGHWEIIDGENDA